MKKVAKFEIISENQFKKDFKDFDAVYEKIKKPERATIYSAGYDIFAPFSITLKPNQSIKVPTGIRVKMENNYVLLIFPRSSLGFKFRLQLDNTVGVIDSDYYNSDNEGHIFIKITNDTKESKNVEIKEGDAFAQGIFLNYGIVEDDNASEIRNGGFGSTNKK